MIRSYREDGKKIKQGMNEVKIKTAGKRVNMKQVKISKILFSIVFIAGMLFVLGGCGSEGRGGGTTTPASGGPDATPDAGDPGVTPAPEDADVTPAPEDAEPAAARQWGIPKTVETVLLQSQWDSSDQNSNARAFSMTSGGDAMVVWPQGNITDESIWAARYTAGSGWGEPVLIETGIGVASGPRVAMNENKDAVAVWYQHDGTQGRIFANTYSAGNWGAAAAIDPGSGSYKRLPQVVIDAGGNAIAIWSEYNGTAWSLYANQYTPGIGWGGAVLLETDNANSVAGETIAMNAAGDAIAAWSVIPVGGSTYSDIFAVRFSPAGGWTVPDKLNNLPLGMYSPPSLTIALDDNANGMAVWNQREGGPVINVVSRSYNSGGWGSLQAVSGGTDNAFDPYVNGNFSGTYVVIFIQDDGTGSNTYDIYVNRYAVGGWGAPQLIETGSGSAGIKPSVAMNSSGVATAVWSQSDSARYNLWANTMDAAGVWGAAQQIEAFVSGGVGNYKAAMDVNGNAMAVWAQASGVYTQIYYNRYE